jgi:hypothetical protein
LYEGGVDAVGGGTGHHAEDEHGFCGHDWVKVIFNTEHAENTEERRRKACKE